jgi:hypothetical protein
MRNVPLISVVLTVAPTLDYNFINQCFYTFTHFIGRVIWKMASFMHDENSTFLVLNTPVTPAAAGLKLGAAGVALFTPSPASASALLNESSAPCMPSGALDACPSSEFSLDASGCGDIAFYIPSTPQESETSERGDAVDSSPITVSDSAAESGTESIASPEASTSNSAGPSSEEVRRQLEESERLAWELMQQDSLEAFNMQLEFIRQNSAGMEEADLRALTQAMEEERAAHEMMVRRAEATARRAVSDEAEREGEEGGEGAGDGEELEEQGEDDSANWTYDQLLALGEAVGGKLIVLIIDGLLSCS